jgi:hypothetical protein
MRQRYRGPRTLKSPEGFQNDADTIREIEHGTNLFGIVWRMVKDLKRLHKEIGETPGRWFVSEDNGSYEVLYSFHSNCIDCLLDAFRYLLDTYSLA